MENVDERYLRVLKEVTGKTDLVKIITGMRGTGKTTLVRRHMDHLRSIGVEDNAMCYLDRDGYGERKSSEELEEALKPCLEVEGDHFIFIDEVQKVPDWESTVEMLISRKDCDVYLTESNLYRLPTKLSCRTMEIDVLPLSFKEFLELHKGDREMRFYQYLEYGPLPSIKLERGKDYCFFQSEGTYCTILHKDIVSHTLGRPHILDTICRSLFSNIGKVINAERISVESGLSDDTVRKCLKPLVGSRLFYHAKRYDIVKKRTYPQRQILRDGSGYEESIHRSQQTARPRPSVGKHSVLRTVTQRL